jgi:dUTP pyrophosphatase
VKVKVVNMSLNGLPEYTNEDDAGLDLRADFTIGINESLYHFADYDEERKVVMIFPGGRALIPTNIKTNIPKGYEVQIRPRSGLAIKSGVTVLNTPGTIDCGFVNFWGVILINLGDEVFEIEQGDRIAQAVLHKFEKIEWEEVHTLSSTERGESGFGDSGVK